jgi:hypothetical protein
MHLLPPASDVLTDAPGFLNPAGQANCGGHPLYHRVMKTSAALIVAFLASATVLATHAAEPGGTASNDDNDPIARLIAEKDTGTTRSLSAAVTAPFAGLTRLLRFDASTSQPPASRMMQGVPTVLWPIQP